MAVESISDDNFQAEISTGWTLIDFWAEWCVPCRMVEPIVKEISESMPAIKCRKMNVDENMDVPQSLGITSIPTLILFKDGEVVEKVVGLLPGPQLRKILERHVA